MITAPMEVLAVLLGILAALFLAAGTRTGKRVFQVLPLLLFAYFVPTAFSNTGLIPVQSPLYDFIRDWLLPASLILLTLSVDIPAILKLGRNALVLFLGATASIVIGGPLALLALGWMAPESMGDQVWKGLSALSGSWIGGGANMVALGESTGATDSTMGLIIVVDVFVAEIWMAVLLFFAGRERQMDEKIGADRTSLDAVRQKVEDYHFEVARPTDLSALLLVAFLSLGGTAAARAVAGLMPDVGDIIKEFTWMVIFATTIGLGLSFTRLRRMEGAGSGAVGSVFLYLLVASIGAKAEFHRVVEAPELVLIGALWMIFHATFILWLRRRMKAPIFFAGVGSKANIGGAASAPILAAAFHPALASVGVLLAIFGYVLGTYAGICCAFLLEFVYNSFYAVAG